jgi:hypothetical protein
LVVNARGNLIRATIVMTFANVSTDVSNETPRLFLGN